MTFDNILCNSQPKPNASASRRMTAKEEARAMTVDAFVESVKQELQASSDKSFGEIVETMEIPAEIKERALEYIEAAAEG